MENKQALKRCFRESSLHIYANLVGLCPNCHRFLHFARRADRQTVLSALYTARAVRLHHGGIDVSHDEFIGLET